MSLESPEPTRASPVDRTRRLRPRGVWLMAGGLGVVALVLLPGLSAAASATSVTYTSWNFPWNGVTANSAPCSGSNTYTTERSSPATGAFSGAQQSTASAKVTCLTNTALFSQRAGLHAGAVNGTAFAAWKANTLPNGTAVYRIHEQFSVSLTAHVLAPCAVNSSASVEVQAWAALWDINLGATTFGNPLEKVFALSTAHLTCGVAHSATVSARTVSLNWTCWIASGDAIVPRFGIAATTTASLPNSSTGTAFAAVKFDGTSGTIDVVSWSIS